MLGWVIRLLLVALVLRLIVSFFRGLGVGARGSPAGGGERQARGTRPLVRDPVCGTYIEPARALTSRAGDTVHYFCSETCLRSFRQTA